MCKAIQSMALSLCKHINTYMFPITAWEIIHGNCAHRLIMSHLPRILSSMLGGVILSLLMGVWRTGPSWIQTHLRLWGKSIDWGVKTTPQFVLLSVKFWDKFDTRVPDLGWPSTFQPTFQHGGVINYNQTCGSNRCLLYTDYWFGSCCQLSKDAWLSGLSLV